MGLGLSGTKGALGIQGKSGTQRGGWGCKAAKALLQLHKACPWKQKSAAHSYLALLFASFTDSCLSRM